MKKFLSILAIMSIAANAAAQETEVINADVQKSFEQTQKSMQQSIEKIDQHMQKVMPALSESMAQMMQDFFRTLPPLMKSIEENQVLSKAAEQMNKEINTQIQEANRTFKDFRVYQEQQKSNEQDKFMVAGSKNDNGKTLDFSFSQNEERLQELQKAFNAKTAPDQAADFSITDFKQQRLKGKDFKIEFIDGRNYLVYDDGDNYCYITGIAENNIIIRVQTSGPDALARARNFIKNSRRQIEL